MGRTTVTIESDVEQMLQRMMAEQGISFKEALNSTLRRALSGPAPAAEVSFPSFDMGVPAVDYTHAGRLAAQLEDEALTAELATGR